MGDRENLKHSCCICGRELKKIKALDHKVSTDLASWENRTKGRRGGKEDGSSGGQFFTSGYM